MTNGRYWVVKNHPWTGVAHHLTNLLSHLGLVAVYFTLRAKVLLLHKGTFASALIGILCKLATLVAELCSAVIITTVKRNHIAHHPSLVL